MREPLTRAEIRRRALRAATAVAASVAVNGCADLDVPVYGASSADGVGTQDGVTAADGAGFALDAGAADRGGPFSIGGGAADVAADVAAADADDRDNCKELMQGDWGRYQKCCDENGWDWNKGCMAWGPPPPPAMDERLLRSLLAADQGVLA